MSGTKAEFEISGQVKLETGPGGFSFVKINGRQASAEVCLHGAHVTHFQPHGQSPLLWMSPDAVFRAGKAIRGGVPVCWPWFGPHADDSSLPQHGFARTSEWSPVRSSVMSDGAVEVLFSLEHSPQTLQLWPHEFSLQFRVVVGKSLVLELTATNCGTQPFVAGAALHTYFAIHDIERTTVSGLSGHSYLDQLDGHKKKVQNGVIGFNAEVDRIYLDADQTVRIQSPVTEPVIEISSSGSRSIVVWNPWIDKAARMPDFSDDGYRTMVCVETANAAEDVRTIGPGESHALMQTCRPIVAE